MRPRRPLLELEPVEERRGVLGIAQTEGLMRTGGRVSSSTGCHLERGQKITYERSRLRGVSLALGWSSGSIERIAAG